jgi:hypothetical protein
MPPRVYLSDSFERCARSEAWLETYGTERLHDSPNLRARHYETRRAFVAQQHAMP